MLITLSTGGDAAVRAFSGAITLEIYAPENKTAQWCLPHQHIPFLSVYICGAYILGELMCRCICQLVYYVFQGCNVQVFTF